MTQRQPHDDDPARKRRRVVLLQRYVFNPPMKAAVWAGLVRGHLLVETLGRVTGRRRRTVVGYHRAGSTLWVVAEQGRHAGYVRNLEARPHVRVRIDRRWQPAVATAVDGDDPVGRLASFGNDKHAALVQRAGTSLLSIRFDL
ncbi:MAG: hypothetical protein QOJ03_1565 [Frankiaceae bacterium]|nr:hypothetical protein [Frankiaceae bacterium]